MDESTDESDCSREETMLSESDQLARQAKLGFKPQKELWCNLRLPYADRLDDESQELLKLIKSNFVKALVHKEMNPGFYISATQLSCYIKLYGLKFSKEDHLLFIKVLLEAMCLTHLETSKVSKLCTILIELLSKRYLLTPDDLQIDWRPLYKLTKIYFNRTSNKCVMYRFFQTLENNLQYLLHCTSPYYGKAACQEILDEILPQLEPLDVGRESMEFELLTLFLSPYYGYELWLDHFLKLWDVYYNPVWTADMMNLIAPTACCNIGRIDWEPYIPSIFTRILRSLELPVTYKNMTSHRNQSFHMSSAAIWIVSVLGPNSSAQKYLDNFMTTIETYVHPANTGNWLKALSELLVNMVVVFEKRIVNERFRKPCWTRTTPVSHHLTEECITKFVKSFRPVALQAIYSRMNPNNTGKLIKILTELRPELIIPEVIERVYSCLGLLTEPHKLTASLQTLQKVARPLMTGRNGYTAGRADVIPIMMELLPGIDPNDFKKTCVVLQFYVSFSLLMPLVDCSKAAQFYDDLTEEESTLCSQTAMLEDFVLQFLDRIFVLIDSSSSQIIRMEQADTDNSVSKLEAIAESSILTSVHTIICQSSKEIIALAADKTLKFVKTHIYEPKVASIVGGLVRIIGRVAGHNYFKSIVPFLVDTLNGYFAEQEQDIATLDRQSDEVLYYFQLLSNVVRGDPVIAIDYMDQLMPILDQVMTFNCIHASSMANNMIMFTMANFTMIQNGSTQYPKIWTHTLAEFLPIRHWGDPLMSDDKLDWYIPGEKARAFCEQLLHRYLMPTLDFFEQYIRGEVTPSREDLLKRINLVSALLKAQSMLPNWTHVDERESAPNTMFHSVVSRYEFDLELGFGEKAISMPDGSNVRLKVVDTIMRLQDKILQTSEDDIKSLKAIGLLWDKVCVRKHGGSTYESQYKNFVQMKCFQDFKLTHKKRNIRCVVSMRVLMHQNLRDELSKPLFTKTHERIVKKLLQLSTSKYSTTRKMAQGRLLTVLGTFPFAYRCIMDDLVQLLRLDSTEHHAQFKGALYLLHGTRSGCLLVKDDWLVIRRLWIGLLASQVSEKPSVTKLIDGLIDAVKFDFPTINIRLTFTESLQQCAREFCANDDDAATLICPETIAAGNHNETTTNETNVRLYYEILNEIIDIVKNRNLHWRYNYMASTMMLHLTHPNVNHPEIVARYFVHNLLNDSLDERKLAIQMMGYVMLQQKREHTKVTLDPFQVAGVERQQPTEERTLLLPCFRQDNEWLLYNPRTVPKSQADWDDPRYVFKAQGFFGWRNHRVEMYAPTAEQPNIEWTRDEMTDVQRVIFDFFSDKSNVSKLLHFWAMEGKKGHEQFKRGTFFLVRALCSMFGDQVAEHFVAHLPRLITENKENEGNHRCAAEIVAGIARGTKHWPYAKIERMMTETVVPMIRLALKNITTDTDVFWNTCFALCCENIDPMRQWWIHEALLEDPLRETASYINCGRILSLQCAFNTHVWRMPNVAHRLLDYFRPHLAHSFQNVREAIAALLINVFEMDFRYPGTSEPKCPRIRSFIDEVMPQLQILHNDFPRLAEDHVGDADTDGGSVVKQEDEQFHKAVRLFKTIAQWVTLFMNRSTNGNREEFFELLPFACRLERCEQDTELALICTKLLSMLSQALTLTDTMEAALNKIEFVSRMSYWSARFAVLGVLQVLVFNNMSLMLSQEEWVKRAQDIVLRLLEDKVVEVREKAALVLGGFVHCSFLPSTEKLLELFKKKCRTKINSSRKRPLSAIGSDDSDSEGLVETGEQMVVRIRHTGVLGLCAFIAAYPYDIPDFVPDVFEHLGANLNDPPPIPSTILKTVGDFKRTHHDNWETHQAKFTEDQLAVLSDLTVPPSYYN